MRAELAIPFEGVRLRESMEVAKGTLPVVLTVPHDGELTEISGTPLPYHPENKKRDLHTATIAKGIASYMESTYGQTPTLVMQRVKRQHITPAVHEHFMETVLSELNEMTHQYPAVLLLDVHGFSDRPPEGEEIPFDMILGTRHRQTVSNDHDDVVFARHMRKNEEFTVFLPSKRGVLGEKFDATPDHTVMTAIYRSGMVPHVRGIQVEIAARHRFNEAGGRERVVQAIGDFSYQWAQPRMAA